jgi:flagellar motor protein MotB
MSRLRLHAVSVLFALAFFAGCSQNLLRRETPPAVISLEPPPGIAAPAHTLPQPLATLPEQPSYANLDGRQLEAALARSQTENQLVQEELAALREQLASTTAQLAASRTVARPQGATTAASPGAGESQAAAAAAAMQSAIGQLSLGDLAVRLDGAVVRIEIPADRLFDDTTANLLPAGVALLTQLAAELERVFPSHFLGIEGHIDSEPIRGESWESAHQLTAAQAAAVFDFLASRTPLEDGQMFLVAHGANHPVVSNATAAGRQRNRRIECVIYPERAP